MTITDNLTIGQDTTLDGTGQRVTIDGNGAGSVITVNAGVRLAVTSLTLTNGSNQFGQDNNGGGINNRGGGVILTDSTVSDSSAGGFGGGIANDTGGGVELIRSTVSGNSTLLGGAGIANGPGGRVTLIDSTVSGNHDDTTFPDGSPLGGGQGAGIYDADGGSGAVTVIDSTVSGNSVTRGGFGGGIYVASGTVTLTGSTVSGNSATGAQEFVPAEGGGIYVFSGTTTLANSTVSGNSAELGGGGIYINKGAATLANSTVSGNSAKFGGGVAGSFTLTATILAGNSGPVSGPDCQNNVPVTSGGYNLIGDTTGCTFSGATAHDITGQAPQLGPLQDNGGPTLTQAPAAGSPAIGAIPVGIGSGLCPAADQRGYLPAPGAPTCDIGAVQSGYRLPATVTIDPASLAQTYDGAAKAARASVSPASCGPVTLSYSQNGSPVAAPAAAGSYTVQSSLGNSACAIASGGTGTLVIAPAQATVTLGALRQTYDGTPKAASVTTSPAGLRVTVTYNSASAAPTNAGSYAVVATVSDPNYVGSATGTLTIAAAAQTITFAAPAAHTYGDASFTVAATGGASGAPVTFSAGPSQVCTSSGTNGATITLVGAGTCTVTANQAGNGNYSAAPAVTQSFAVRQATLTVTADDKSVSYGGALPALTVTYSGFVNGDTATHSSGSNNPLYTTITGAPSCATTATSGGPGGGGSPVGSYPITCARGTLGATNYIFDFRSGTLTVQPAALTITPDNQSMVYGGAVPSFTVGPAGYSGLVNGDSASVAHGLSCGATDGGQAVSSSTPAGSYAITCSGASAANYSISYKAGMLTITPAPQVIAVTSTPPSPARVGATYTVAASGLHGRGQRRRLGQPGHLHGWSQ